MKFLRAVGITVAALGFLGLPLLSAAEDAISALSLKAAIERALSLSPQQRIAEQEPLIADQQRQLQAAELHPQLSAEVSQNRQTLNPAVLGFPLPLDQLPSVIGPYSVFDARLRLSQRLLDLARSSELAGAGFAVEAAQAQAEQQRQHLAAQVALSFIEVLSGEQSLQAAQADLGLAEDLLTIARDQRSAGIASGVDVARAETAVAQDRYALAEVQTAIASARLRLQRLAFLPMDSVPQLQGQLSTTVSGDADLSQVLARARQDRAEMALVEAQLQRSRAQARAAWRKHLPTVSVFADYGLSSRTPGNADEDTYRYGAMLDLPLYTGGALRAEQALADRRAEQQQLQLEDLQLQIEQDVRLALANLGSTAEQVQAATATRDLAERELSLARDRFANGVANNVDVVSAQAALSRSRAQVVRAQAAYQQARVNLAAAQGHARSFEL